MRKYAAYIRVSTVRQGERGVSLPEQRSVIEGYARREGLNVETWYEERETAARTGRTQFRAMLRDLKRGVHHGLILHKIDRGARNLSDWAALSELADSGVDVRIAGDTLDLGSRGGRLSADIQAVVAADYIRNLREEVKKGQRGRLKQGFYPWAAPIGYLDNGSAQPKTIDPVRGPLIRRGFEAYATGNYSIRTLRALLTEWGLRKPGGAPLSRNNVNAILRRPFYYGLVTVGGESFAGNHPPLVSKELFDQVQAVLDGRIAVRSYQSRPYVFRRMVECAQCGRHLYAEVQKGNAYYRCHSDGCAGTCLRETAILSRVLEEMSSFPITDEVLAQFEEYAARIHRELAGTDEADAVVARVQLGALKERTARLTDALIDAVIDRETYDEKKRRLEEHRLRLESQLATPNFKAERFKREADRSLELLKGLQTLDERAINAEMRDVLQTAISNCRAYRKDVEITWGDAVRDLFAREPAPVGPHARDSYRTSWPQRHGYIPTDAYEAMQAYFERLLREVERAAKHQVTCPVSSDQ
jgi:DNA invertase Pin-like site-specific DNA recombinase